MKRVLLSSLPFLYLAVWLCSLPLFAQSPVVPHMRALPERPALSVAHTFVVTDTGDAGDANPADTLCYPCTLRAAMENAARTPGTSMVVFSPSVSIVSLRTALPGINRGIIIDGRLDGTRKAVIDGTLLPSSSGLSLSTGRSSIRNLEIRNFLRGIWIESYADSSEVLGCFIHDNRWAGIDFNSNYIMIGALESGSGNTIARNGRNGITAGGMYATVTGNRIGTIDGTSSASNGGNGISIAGQYHIIQGNLSSGNHGHGIYSDQSAWYNTMIGNHIGITASGLASLPNGTVGIYLLNGRKDTIMYNVISGNSGDGIGFGNTTWNRTADLHITGNIIGPNARGDGRLPSSGQSAGISGIGRNIYISENVISGNTGDGVYACGFGWTIRANRIGTDSAGLSSLSNGRHGIMIPSPYPNIGMNMLIGGASEADGNLISANLGSGIFLENTSTLHTTIAGNSIGVARDGITALPNQADGITLLHGAQYAVIDRNLISGNGAAGIRCGDELSNDNLIRRNRIGTDASGNRPVPNSAEGIVCAASTRNQVGGIDSGNVIAYNKGDGISILDHGTNVICGNTIFENKTGILLSRPGASGGENDTLDLDVGPNGLQNYPTIGWAKAGIETRIVGVLNSKRSQSYRLEFFASPACDSGGFGQGARLLGAASIATDANGIASFAVRLGVASVEGEAITATATDTLGNTSQFSRCVTAWAATAAGTPEIVDAFSLSQNYPNPFTERSSITFELPTASHATLRVYNSLGELVSTLVDAPLPSGTHTVDWPRGVLPAGMYRYALSVDGRTLAGSAVVLR